MKRMGTVVGIKPEKIDEYKRLHAETWPAVLAAISKANIRNYTIFLREPENLLFGYWEYHGDDFEADAARIAADPQTQEWWTFTDLCQIPMASRENGEQWSMMEQIFHND
jgi:L-rhamnose mutarotase